MAPVAAAKVARTPLYLQSDTPTEKHGVTRARTDHWANELNPRIGVFVGTDQSDQIQPRQRWHIDRQYHDGVKLLRETRDTEAQRIRLSVSLNRLHDLNRLLVVKQRPRQGQKR